MKAYPLLGVLLVSGVWAYGQERTPPKDSARISVAGCVKGRSLIAMARGGAEPTSNVIAPGRRLRLSGPKKMVAEIRAEKTQFVEVTGLVRRSQISPANEGIAIGKSGRIRIGGGPPNYDPTKNPGRDPLANEPVMDVESWRPLPESCPAL